MPRKVRSREVMGAEVMRDALTSALEGVGLVRGQLGLARNLASEFTRVHGGYSFSTMLLDREYELRNTAIWLQSALDSLNEGVIVPVGQSSPAVKGGGDGKSEPVGQSGADVRSRRGHRI